jgi:cytoskeletal protein RodZ
MRNRNGARTGAIAASVASVILFVAVVTLFLWVSRRRQRIQQRVPENFIESRDLVVLEPSAVKVDAPATAESAEAEVDLPQLMAAVVSDETPLKLTEPSVIAPEESVAPISESQGTARNEEALTLRMRRMEAQLEALLTLGLPEGSPPSYCG